MTNGASKMAAASAGCGWSVLKWATGTNFAIQLAGFSIANWFKTEKFFDLTGAMTNIVVPSMCFFMGRNNRSSRLLVCKIQYACVVLWAARLGSFLFYRVMKDDGDRRFDKIKKSTASFFAAWMVQGVWVSLISLPTCCMFLMQKNIPVRPAPAHILGWSMFAVGFLLEAVADQQKLSFNSNKENEKEFMRSGLWSLSRHPNYLGEVILWWGLYLSAVASTRCRFYRSSMLISPLFVTYLLGVFSLNMLERSSEKKYGSHPDYQSYKDTTRKLIPFLY